ncbi:MAG: formate dehydrogenase-specific chaperone [Campylobacter sp.]|nr:formate dehydrogenase-specific chaperone [Campylobacter sp.]
MNNSNEITKARAFYYEFFATPFFFSESDEKFIIWKKQLEILAQNPLNDANAKAFEELKKLDFTAFKLEQNNVLFDFNYVNIPLSASFYEEGRDDGAARLRVIEILKKNLYVKDLIKCDESEDYVGFIFASMSKFLSEEALNGFDENSPSSELFISVINGFIDEFIENCEGHERAFMFSNLMIILRSFIQLERSLLGVNAPYKDPSVQSPAQAALNRQPYKSKMPSVKAKIATEEFSLADKEIL